MMHKMATAVFLVIIIQPWAVRCQDSLSVKTWGPLSIGPSPGVQITAQVKSNGRTDLCVKLIAASGTLQLPESCVDDSDGTCRYALAEVPTPTQGNLLLLMDKILPSAPGSGINGRFYSVDPAGRIIPVTGWLYPETNSLSASEFPVVSKIINQKSTLCVKILGSTGNFAVFCYYPIHLEGTTEIQATEWVPPQYEVSIDTNEARRQREFYTRLDRGDGPSDTVHLYAKPSKLESQPEPVHIQPNSSVQFLDAVEDRLFDPPVQRHPWWLHLKIDGKVGYIHEDDFWSIGLPAAG
jgi:hypothetical protein